EAAALAREAIEMATALGATGVEANARTTLGSSIVWFGEIDEALASIERAFAVASARDDIEEMARAAKHRTVTLLIADRLAETASAGREAFELARRYGLEGYHGIGALMAAVSALRALGRYREVDESLDTVKGVGVDGILTFEYAYHRIHQAI